MLQVTIPFTNEVVFNPDHHADNEQDEVVVNRFDEVRGAIHICVKSFHVEGIVVYLIKLKCPESVLVSARVDKPAWLMNFTLKGQLSIHGENTGLGLKLSANTHDSFIPASGKALDIVIQGEVTLFAVCLSDDVVKKLLSDEENTALQRRLHGSTKRISGRAITPAMDDVLNAVIHCAENNCLHRIFLAAKTLELLFLDIEQLNKWPGATVSAVKINDIEKLTLAKELIAKDLQAPCSLIELARKVGLNDFKLKKGFKDVFGTTVFGYLFDMRMERAKELLSLTDNTVSEVANEVGYKNAHHFTAAFKKKFGYLPSKRRL